MENFTVELAEDVKTSDWVWLANVEMWAQVSRIQKGNKSVTLWFGERLKRHLCRGMSVSVAIRK